MYVKNSVIRKNYLLLFTFSDKYEVPSTEEPRDFEEHDDDDDDDDDHIVREFNDEFTQAVLRSTFGTFHSCAEMGTIQPNSITPNQNRSVSRRQKRGFWLAFGPPGLVIGLVICKLN